MSSSDIPSYTVAIIEDQRMFRELLQALVNGSEWLNVVGTATNGAEGWDVCQRERPQVALIDIELPDTSGIDLGLRLKTLESPPVLVAVSSMVDPITTTRGFESGFHGYVEKNQSPEIVIEAIHTAAEGGLYFTDLVRQNRRHIFNEPDAVNKILSPREQLIIGHVSLGHFNREIAKQLSLSVRTVENHRYRIMKKLALGDAQELVNFGHQLGLHRLV